MTLSLIKNKLTFSLPLVFLVIPNVAVAQTFPFTGTYSNTANATSILMNQNFSISLTEFEGTSQDALYGLTKLRGQTYSQINLLTGELIFTTDPSLFGLNLPPTSVIFEALDGSQLIGSDLASGFVDFSNLIATASGTFTITQGTGRFQGATGVLTFSEIDQLSLDPSFPTTGIAQASGTFSIPAIPEPNSISGLLILGLFFLRKSTQHH